ncbi:MAG: universal stress protein [Candidatus Omnitrophota bacterium]
MGLRTIVVSIAGSPSSLITAKYAIALAKLLSVKLVALYVVDKKVLQDLLKSRIFVDVEARVYERDLEQQGAAILERISKMALDKGIAFESFLMKGVVSDEVFNKAQELQADLLVMGELKEKMSRTEVFYDEGERILRRSPCPIVMVKNPAMVEALYKEIGPL